MIGSPRDFPLGHPELVHVVECKLASSDIMLYSLFCSCPGFTSGKRMQDSCVLAKE